MNDITPEQKISKHSGTISEKGKIKGSSLDRKFPPVWLMGTAVLLVMLLTVLSGWKIVNTERRHFGSKGALECHYVGSNGILVIV